MPSSNDPLISKTANIPERLKAIQESAANLEISLAPEAQNLLEKLNRLVTNASDVLQEGS